MFQFDANDLTLKASAQSVRAELQSLSSGWTLAAWFGGPNARLEGRCPVNVLDSDLDAVVRAARSMAVVEQVPLPLVTRAHETATCV